MAMIVYVRAERTAQQLKVWYGRRQTLKLVAGIQPQDGHYFKDGVCLFCTIDEATYRAAPHTFRHPDPLAIRPKGRL